MMMKKYHKLSKRIMSFSLLLLFSVQAQSFEGCYLQKEEISSYNSHESEIKSTYLHISPSLTSSETYFVEGIVWGANFHVCHITSPIEGEPQPLTMTQVDDKLVYSQYDCDLTFTFKNNQVSISDVNNYCAGAIFNCGTRVGLDQLELPKVQQKCPE